MKIKRVTHQEYLNRISFFATIFDTPLFQELNRDNCEEIYYLFGESSKLKFALIGGVRAGVFFAPFSAPYQLVTTLRNDISLKEYYEFIKSLVGFLKEEKIKAIQFIFPPAFYSESVISGFQNCLFQNDFSISYLDLNYHYDLSRFDQNYDGNIIPTARQKLRSAIKNGLTIRKIDLKELIACENVYQIILKNRLAKNYPLKMSFEKIISTCDVIRSDWFLVSDSDGNEIASALCFHVADRVVQVVYWGDLPEKSHLRPMNFLAYKIFEYYKNQNMKYVDIGPSTDQGIPNFGLCDFKQSIGCDVTSKMTFTRRL